MSEFKIGDYVRFKPGELDDISAGGYPGFCAKTIHGKRHDGPYVVLQQAGGLKLGTWAHTWDHDSRVYVEKMDLEQGPLVVGWMF